MKPFVCFMMVIAFCFPGYASGLDGNEYLRKGKSELAEKQYDRAIADLAKAEQEFPLLGDYALFWLSEAYRESGDHEGSLNAVRRVLKKYPASGESRRSRARRS